jgi:hypothetical protein
MKFHTFSLKNLSHYGLKGKQKQNFILSSQQSFPLSLQQFAYFDRLVLGIEATYNSKDPDLCRLFKMNSLN